MTETSENIQKLIDNIESILPELIAVCFVQHQWLAESLSDTEIEVWAETFDVESQPSEKIVGQAFFNYKPNRQCPLFWFFPRTTFSVMVNQKDINSTLIECRFYASGYTYEKKYVENEIFKPIVFDAASPSLDGMIIKPAI